MRIGRRESLIVGLMIVAGILSMMYLKVLFANMVGPLSRGSFVHRESTE
jgi:hypothetical protein